MKNANYNIEEIEDTYYEDSFVSHGIALAHNPKSNMWCTWAYRHDMREKDTERRWSFFWGHYYDREKDARADYHKRLMEEYEK